MENVPLLGFGTKAAENAFFPLGDVSKPGSAASGMPELSPSRLNWAVGLFNIIAMIYWKNEVLALWRKSEGCIAVAVESI